ncbi:winged helix DNA-binding domain-containing protein [Mycolicibacterium sp.]|uniref:winged helix DNA-binding domain-containing protein n=1 Tax=Mycolicibacterium sp. TaxID=2320850 RepID=UPI003D0CE7E8
MRCFTVDERRSRLARRHFLLPDAAPGSAAALTGALVGLHGTDPATPYLSLWARLPGCTAEAVSAELYRHRRLVKHLAMRRTLWVVRAEDLPLVQSAASDRVAAAETRRLVADAENAGVSADGQAWLAAASAAVHRHLVRTGPCTATELRTALPELAGTYDPAPGRSWGGETHLAPRVLTVMSARGEVVRGPNDGTWTVSRPRWVATNAWLGPTAAVPGEQARTELVRRWLAAFGPATVTDLKWWFGSTLGWARDGLREVGAVAVDLHGTPGFALPEDLEPEPKAPPWCALLPGLDVTTMGWVDRDWYLDGLHEHVFDRRGNAGPTAWVDGRVVGAWAHGSDGRVQLRLATDVSRTARKALQCKADELTEWLGGVRVRPRFPAPLSKD